MRTKPKSNRASRLLRLKPNYNKPSNDLGCDASSSLQIRRILMPIDFSEGSANALRYGEDVARAVGAQITILNVIPLNEGLLRLGANQLKVLDEQMKENQRRHMVNFVRSIGLTTPGD